MADKNYTEINIAGRKYRLAGTEDAEYLQSVAGYVNEMMDQIRRSPGYRRMTSDMKTLMLELNLADEYMKAKERAEKLEARMDEMELEIFDLKHELVSKQMRRESSKQEGGNTSSGRRSSSKHKNSAEGDPDRR